jgi:hypothetical protein
LWPFGTFYGYLVYFFSFWYIALRKTWQPWQELHLPSTLFAFSQSSGFKKSSGFSEHILLGSLVLHVKLSGIMGSEQSLARSDAVFSVPKGCQIFLGAIYPNWKKFTQ